MVLEQKISVDQRVCLVILSDEEEALSAAKAAGRAFVGILGKKGYGPLREAEYVLALPEELSGKEAPEKEPSWNAYQREILTPYLERVVRRHWGLPWEICSTRRLEIREFTLSDVSRIPKEPEDTPGDAVFYTPDLLKSYIRNQYHFYEYGIWAVVRKADGVIVGTAGVTSAEENPAFPLELGYHIFTPYRRQGYAREACQGILSWVKEEWDCPVCARVKPDNTASVRLLEQLGVPYWTV